MKQIIIAIAALMTLLSCGGQKGNKVTNENKEDMTQITYNKIQVDNCKVFYREAGNPENPTVLLLHGFPSSSHMFRELMPELADEFHLIAPDFPSYGQTDHPSRSQCFQARPAQRRNALRPQRPLRPRKPSHRDCRPHA